MGIASKMLGGKDHFWATQGGQRGPALNQKLTKALEMH